MILIINICKEKLHYVRNSSNLVISEHKKIAFKPTIFCAENSKNLRGIFLHPKVRRKINTGLLYYEFVKPVCDILDKNGIEYSVKHYKELSKEDLKKAEKIIICGTSLYDNNFINDTENSSNYLSLDSRGTWRGFSEFSVSKPEKALLSWPRKFNKNFLWISNKLQEIFDINKFNWIKKIKKPILGICGGMQIIGLVFNGKLKKKTEENKNFLKKKTEIGFYKEFFKKEFLGLKNEKEVYHLHNYYVNFSALKEFEIFCESKGIVQAVKHRKKEIYGVLFHPEVRNKELIEKFCEI